MPPRRCGRASLIRDEYHMPMSYKLMNSPVGLLKLVASEKALVAILWENDDPVRVRLGDVVEEPFHRVLVQTEKELKRILHGKKAQILFIFGHAWYTFSKGGMGGSVGYSFWRNMHLRRHRKATWKACSQSSCGRGKPSKSNFYHYSMPPCRGCGR